MSTQDALAPTAVLAPRRRRRPLAFRPAQAASLDELIADQGVSPAEDLDAIGRLWPGGDDPEELLRHILDERAARRRLARGEE